LGYPLEDNIIIVQGKLMIVECV